ncbi:NAD(P)/FAD-dependent oxidoreductase [Anoxynatronum sibiricum]|uniref:NAD(P)/FAD-dependent oxidoreductase n=1 Tax=Anoxynatronum sibiricum TaxID=210623 RepID=A0ABU9VPF5_9CLOT
MTTTETHWDVIVIGAGPGGLMAAITAAVQGCRVLVLEKNDQPGRKLLATGGGQCNLTHQMPMKSFLPHYHEKAVYAGKCIRQFPPESLMQWFSQRGVRLEVLENGKVFPASRRATEVLEALLTEVKRLKVVMNCRSPVKKLETFEEGFQVACEKQVYKVRNVILSTGGCTYPSLGTTGDGYRLAADLGHSVIAPRLALTGLSVSHWKLEDLSGVSLQEITISHWREGRKAGTYTGDLLFTHLGVSGPVILNYSRYFQPGDLLTLNLAAPEKEEAFSDRILRELQSMGKKKVKTLLYKEPMPRRVMDIVMKMAGIADEQVCASVTKDQRKMLVKWMTRMPLEVGTLGDVETAMVTAGGVSTDEIRSSTMESFVVPGLFFVGEVQDVDGMTGGFNLQFAFSSGYVAGCTAASRQKEGGSSCR